MNINEYCLLNFLINPDELKDISSFFINNIEEKDKNRNTGLNCGYTVKL